MYRPVFSTGILYSKYHIYVFFTVGALTSFNPKSAFENKLIFRKSSEINIFVYFWNKKYVLSSNYIKNWRQKWKLKLIMCKIAKKVPSLFLALYPAHPFYRPKNWHILDFITNILLFIQKMVLTPPSPNNQCKKMT